MKQKQITHSNRSSQPNTGNRSAKPKKQLEPPLPYIVQLRNIGNPDHGQNPLKPLPMTRCIDRPVMNLILARTEVLNYIKSYRLGGGNWSGGRVVDANTGREVAYISYNGRIWQPAKEFQERKPYPPLVLFTTRTGIQFSYAYVNKEFQMPDFGRTGSEWVFPNPVNDDEGLLVRISREGVSFQYAIYAVSYHGIERWKKKEEAPLYSGYVQPQRYPESASATELK